MTKTYFPDLFGPFEEEDDSAETQAWNQKRMAKKAYRAGKKVADSNQRTVKNTASRPWPDLPHQLIRIISKQEHHLAWVNRNQGLLQSISFDGVAKTWRSASKQCCNNPKQPLPQLELIVKQKTLETNNMYSIPELLRYNEWWGRRDKRRYTTNIKDTVIGCSHGQLIMRSLMKNFLYGECKEYYRLSPPQSSMGLPKCPEGILFGRAVLSSPSRYSYYGSTNCTMLVLTGGTRGGFMYYKFYGGEYRWIEEECTLVDPNSSRSNPCTIQFTNVVGSDGKFYALSLQGTLAVIDTYSIDPAPRVTILCAKRAIPSTWSRCFKEYLVESCGEILLVFLISAKTVDIVDGIEVFRLDLDNRSWERMVSLGDRTFFVGANCFLTVCPSKLGCRANCIYFTQAMKDGWWVFDLDGGSITEGWNDNSTDKSPTWDIPAVECSIHGYLFPSVCLKRKKTRYFEKCGCASD